MKIIDFKLKGNLIRLYLGQDDLNDYYGDDWDDKPYEHNAGTVYDEFVSQIIDVVLPFDAFAIEACEDHRFNQNSPYCKNSFRDNNTPFVVIVPKEVADDNCFIEYLEARDNKKCFPLYFNENIEEALEKVKAAGGSVLK